MNMRDTREARVISYLIEIPIACTSVSLIAKVALVTLCRGGSADQRYIIHQVISLDIFDSIKSTTEI